MPHSREHRKALMGTLLMTLLYAFHYGIPLYATSSYLGLSFSKNTVSLLFGVASILTLFASLHITRYIRRFHNYQFTQSIVVAEIICSLGFALTSNPVFLAIFFVVHFVLSALLYISINTFMEAFSPHHETGMIRGIFLTILNLGILISPFFGGAILARSGYSALYIVAAAALVPLMILLYRFMRHIPDPHFTSIDIFGAFKRGMKDKNLKIIITAMFLLECFYAIMVIYSPLYITSLGIPLTVYLTAILPIALTPLVILPYELGLLADTKLGEKELLITGLVIMSLMSLVIALTTTTSIAYWIFILVISRVGASFVETMAFTYYFKKIGSEDIGLIALFGNIRSLAIIFVPCLGVLISPLLGAFPSLMFVLISLMLVYGAFSALRLKDTR